MSHIKLFFIFSLLMSLVGCSHVYGENGVIKDRDTDYLKARSIEPLRIPSGYSSASIQSNYPVSDRNYPHQNRMVNVTPPGLYTSNSGQ